MSRVPSVLIAETFLDSLAELDPADAKRATLFLDKLVRAPEAAALRPEMVHDAADRAIRSFKVTHDLRAIAHVHGDATVLLFVSRHSQAYAWIRGRCIACHDHSGAYRLVTGPSDPAGTPLATHVCDSSGELCRLLDARGIAHDLKG